MRPKTSPIWKVPEDQFRQIITNADSIGEALKQFGLINKGANYKTLHRRCIVIGLNLESITKRWRAKIMNNLHNFKRQPIEKILTVNSTFNRTNLKARLIKEKLLIEKCTICGLLPMWNSSKLTLILDHINGISTDNRLMNLRLLYPNCNSQQSTFAGRHNKGIRTRKLNKCECGKTIGRLSLYCITCRGQQRRKVKNRPTVDILKFEVANLGYEAVGRKYGVSGNAIKKWIFGR